MKVKRILCIVFSCLSLLTVIPSCGLGTVPKESSDNPIISSSDIQAAPKTQSAMVLPSDSESVSSVQSDLNTAVNQLKSDKSVEQYEVSHNSAKIAIIKTTGNELNLSVLTLASNQEIKIAEITGNLYDPKWSYDDKYFTVNEGTSILRNTYVLYSDSLKIKNQVANTGMLWAPYSESIAFAIVNKVRPAVDIELDGTTDIYIYDMDHLKSRSILKATKYFMYSPIKWDKSGLYISKDPFNNNKSDTVKLDMQ
jgi:Tol biopolymer transport system component